MEKLTIHRALSELKLIGARIDKQIDDIQPSGIAQKGKLVNGVYQREVFESSAKERFQSATALIDRRNKIKSAIVAANGLTAVTIAGERMTIADAINLKAVIVYKRKLIDTLKRKHNSAKSQLELNNKKVEENALHIASVALSKEGVKIGDDDAGRVIGPFLEANRFELVDPIGVEKTLEEMEKKINDFEVEVDATLSEINAITMVEF